MMSKNLLFTKLVATACISIVSLCSILPVTGQTTTFTPPPPPTIPVIETETNTGNQLNAQNDSPVRTSVPNKSIKQNPAPGTYAYEPQTMTPEEAKKALNKMFTGEENPDGSYMSSRKVDDLLNDQKFLEQRLKDLKAQKKNSKPKKASRLPNGQRPTALGRWADRFVDQENARQAMSTGEYNGPTQADLAAMRLQSMPNMNPQSYYVFGPTLRDSGFVNFTPTTNGGFINTSLIRGY